MRKIPQDKKRAFAVALNNLEAISVREEQGVVICKDLGCNECRVNIDPTFLLSKDEWVKVIKMPKRQLPKKYVVTYFLGEMEKTGEKIIHEYCSANNIHRIDLNSVAALEWFDITPFEFLYLIKNAEFVFTDSFHASVFSIIFGKKFLTSDRDTGNDNQMNSRIDTLFSTFSCENHRMNTFSGNYDELKLDELEIKKIIQNEADRTYDYFSSTVFK